MTAPLRIGVVGTGSLGYHHARILREIPGVAFRGFFEANPERAGTVQRELGVRAGYTGIRQNGSNGVGIVSGQTLSGGEPGSELEPLYRGPMFDMVVLGLFKEAFWAGFYIVYYLPILRKRFDTLNSNLFT